MTMIFVPKDIQEQIIQHQIDEGVEEVEFEYNSKEIATELVYIDNDGYINVYIDNKLEGDYHYLTMEEETA